MLTFRPLDLERDAPWYAELLSTAYPQPVTVERVLEWEKNFPPDGFRRRMVGSNEDNVPVGYNHCATTPFMLPNTFSVEVIVSPDWRGRGYGSELYMDALAFATSRRAQQLECEVRDHHPEWLRFAENRGFKVDRHVFESRLDLASFDETRFAGAIESVQAQGIRLFSLADAGETEENCRKLYELNKQTALDIPGADGTFPRYEDFHRFVFEASWYSPEGQFLAADGKRWVGLGAVGYFKDTNSTYNMHTGVDRGYRGRGIALALKLLTIRRSRALGAVYLRTNNDSQNAPILAINRKLGFQPSPGYYKCIKKLRE